MAHVQPVNLLGFVLALVKCVTGDSNVESVIIGGRPMCVRKMNENEMQIFALQIDLLYVPLHFLIALLDFEVRGHCANRRLTLVALVLHLLVYSSSLRDGRTSPAFCLC